jgi:hypothetical protein
MVASPKGLGPKKHCAGETSSNFKRETRPLVRESSALSNGHKRVDASPFHLRTETDQVSEMMFSLVFLEYRTMDKSKNPVILIVMLRWVNPLQSTHS